MKTSKKFKFVIVLTIFIFTAQVLFFSPNLNSQSINQVESGIGGSGNTTIQSDSKSDNTFLYIAAGALVAGLIIWKVFLDKKETKGENKTDSTKASLDEPLFQNLVSKKCDLYKLQNQIPFEMSFGLSKDKKGILGNELSLGFKLKL